MQVVSSRADVRTDLGIEEIGRIRRRDQRATAVVQRSENVKVGSEFELLNINTD